MKKGRPTDHQSLEELLKIMNRTRRRTDFYQEFEITTDHSVAKVRYVAKVTTKSIWIFWGDFESDKLSVYDETDFSHSPEFGLPEVPAHRTYSLCHVYDVPKDCREFKKLVTVRILDHSGRIHQFSRTIHLSSPCHIANDYGQHRDSIH
ncbi:hypothetical protein [Maribacter polysaccharolyticus]|uniref:hypothetical protein n=1 Tax=Maribacter polysaccharolyticus TaxID=3020831 RepID=UPI00237F774D|nr:hypothetical protein [Maribacter polysaccharolyticus]MDE3743490.1 hypothetical protein [Maribacter polysaccharolyticus]